MTRFAELASVRSGHEQMAFALGDELGMQAPDGAERRLEQLAAAIGASLDPLGELEQLCRVVRGSYVVKSNGSPLLSQVLLRGGGQSDGLAVLAAAVAARARIDVDLVSDGDRLFLAHRALGAPTIADVAREEPLFDGRTLGTDLTWQCGHESAFAVLRQVARRADQTGDLATELASLALLLELPLTDDARQSYLAHHRHLLARLN
jgi:hypothetical protein